MPNEPRLRDRYRQNGVQKIILFAMVVMAYGPVTALLDGRSLDWWFVFKTYAILYGLWYFAGNAVQIAYLLPYWFATAISWLFHRSLDGVENRIRKRRRTDSGAAPRREQEYHYDASRFSERPAEEEKAEQEPKKEHREPPREKPAPANSAYGTEKHHPDDAKLWNVVNDPNASEGEQLNALRAIKTRQARREGKADTKDEEAPKPAAKPAAPPPPVQEKAKAAPKSDEAASRRFDLIFQCAKNRGRWTRIPITTSPIETLFGKAEAVEMGAGQGSAAVQKGKDIKIAPKIGTGPGYTYSCIHCETKHLIVCGGCKTIVCDVRRFRRNRCPECGYDLSHSTGPVDAMPASSVISGSTSLPKGGASGNVLPKSGGGKFLGGRK